ncbi:MAG: family 1 glycosylhydrolase, partial [Microbacterium sp.]
YGWVGPVFITENGMNDGPSAAENPLDDVERIQYVEGFLEWIAAAINEGHDVRGYYLWSLMDNFEWSAGFTAKYGLAALDPVTLDRIPKASASWYRDIIAAHKLARSGLDRRRDSQGTR